MPKNFFYTERFWTLIILSYQLLSPTITDLINNPKVTWRDFAALLNTGLVVVGGSYMKLKDDKNVYTIPLLPGRNKEDIVAKEAPNIPTKQVDDNTPKV